MCLCLCALIFIAVVAVPPVFSLIRLWNSNLRTSVKIAGTAGILGAVGGGLVALHESSEFNWGKRECVDQAQKDCGYPEKWLIVLPMAIWAVFLGVELSRSMVFSQPCGSRNGERTTCLQRTAPCLYNNQPLFWCDLHQSSTAESSTTDRLLEEDNEHSDSPHSSH
ncbi:MAG: hypothetical protein EBX40_01880 [Gammaproteobacteria bacterium]|nr:hypothetical protein [Gammaproteobacteria bacterium]